MGTEWGGVKPASSISADAGACDMFAGPWAPPQAAVLGKKRGRRAGFRV